MYETMDQLRADALDCRKCRLCETRTNVVFGVGNEQARVMFVGEGPGADEDAKGEPFVGRSGQLLDKMLVASGFSRDDNIYIANMVKCRPPKNRDPQPDELEACMGYLRAQVKLIAPAIIVCLGRVAAQHLIDPGFKVTKQHGQFVQRGKTLLTATYHPAALLRSPVNKPETYADFLAVREKLAQLPSGGSPA